jgi:Uma2 family endonuclease
MSTADTSGERSHRRRELQAHCTVSHFDQMIETGELVGKQGRTLQLLRGEVIYMASPGPRNEDVIYLLTTWAFSSEAEIELPIEVSVQLSICLPNQDSVVSPDLAFIKAQTYATRRPTPDDTYLLIEVLDTSLAHHKDALYAEANVVEYWAIDVPNRALIAHRDPRDGRYNDVRTYSEQESVESLRLPGVSLPVGSLFR